MDKKILVVYASKHGATRGIAEHIGKTLKSAGLDVDVRPVGQAGDLAPYAALVLGSAVYMAQWREDAIAFLEANEKWLSQHPVWLFSSGPLGLGDPLKLDMGFIFSDVLQPVIDRIHPRNIVLFSGALDLQKLDQAEREHVQAMKHPVGDFRDWPSIEAWAMGIAEAFKAS